MEYQVTLLVPPQVPIVGVEPKVILYNHKSEPLVRPVGFQGVK